MLVAGAASEIRLNGGYRYCLLYTRICVAVAILSAFTLPAQTYLGTNATGEIAATQTVNLTQIAQQAQSLGLQQTASTFADKRKAAPKLPLPPAPLQSLTVPKTAPMTSLPVTVSSSFGFSGLTHYDQRNANQGNQFSIEPPSPSIAVSADYILEGVNDAIMVYSRAGTPQLAAVLSSNQVFGLPPSINRITNIAGVYTTDMRVFYDAGINRWFVVQRAQCCDSAGNNINQSQIYIAVSQSGDPRGAYKIYVINTTDSASRSCPFGCVADYPQVGSDQYGFYISATEYPLDIFANPSQNPSGVIIWSISKASLAAGVSVPNAFKFALTRTDSFMFAIQPANTPAGASFAVGNGGIAFFVSSVSTGGSNLAVWAMTNTSSIDHLATATPTLIRAIASTSPYSPPINALQRSGSLPYGSTQIPGYEPPLDGSDSRMLSVTYAGGRLYTALQTQVIDENGRFLAGAAYVIFSPTLRGGVLTPSVLRQGYVLTKNANLLRPAIAVNAQGKGAIAFTLVGPDYYPSAAFVPLSTFSTGSAIQIAAAGALPEDGFTGYEDIFGNTARSAARWGDYSTAVSSSDGSIWMVTEFIPNAPRTQFANWGTFVAKLEP